MSGGGRAVGVHPEGLAPEAFEVLGWFPLEGLPGGGVKLAVGPEFDPAAVVEVSGGDVVEDDGRVGEGVPGLRVAGYPVPSLAPLVARAMRSGLGHSSPEAEDKFNWVSGLFEGVFKVAPAVGLIITRAGQVLAKGRS